MGTANTGWFDAGSSPTVQYYIALDCSRASTSSKTVTCSYSIKAKLKSSGSTLGKGYTIAINFSGGGGSSSKDIKASTDSWSGTTERGPWTGSFTFESTGTSTTFTMSSTTNTSTSGKFSDKTLDCSYGAYATAPSKPATPTVNHSTSRIGDTGLKVSWTAPSDGGSAITGYIVQKRRYTSSAWSDWTQHSTPTATNVTAAPTSYYSGMLTTDQLQVRVAAKNAVGTSSYSDAVTIKMTGQVMMKDKDGNERTITSISMKDTSGTSRTITTVYIKDTSGNSHSIVLY